MEKTWMPTVAGLLDIISGPLSLFCAFMTLFAFMDPNVNAILVLSVMGLFAIAGILAIVGGIYALSRKRWGLALAGSIAALSPLLLPGIASITFIARSKKEFQLREYNQIEKKSKLVRFHAMQSIIVFGALMIASFILGWIPFAGEFFTFLISVLSFGLWIVLMVKAYQGTKFKLPWLGNLAEKWVG